MAKGWKTPTENPGPPSWGLGVGQATLPHKTLHATETSMDLPTTYSIPGGESLPTKRSVMTQCDQSRKEFTSQRPFLSSRKTTKIGTWNVRTMYEAGKTAQIAREARNYSITVLGLCETRWIQSGRVRLQTDETVLYSGHEQDNAPHTGRLALMLSPEAKRSLIS